MGSQNGEIRGLRIRYGTRVDSIGFLYGNAWGADHGGSGGDRREFTFQSGEDIVAFAGRDGNRIDQLTFYTESAPGVAVNTYGPSGGGGGDAFYLKPCANTQCPLRWIDGRYGKNL